MQAALPPQKFLPALIVLLASALSGCEKLETLKTYFQSRAKSSHKTVESPKVANPAPVQESPKPAETNVQSSIVMDANVLARVGDWTLTIEDFKERLEALKQLVPDYNPSDRESNKLILEELIRQQLLVQEAMAKDLDKNEDVLAAVEEFRRTVLVREMANQILEGVTVSEDEAKQYYEANKQDFIAPTEWKLREIVVEDEAQAKDILVELYKGANFAETAKAKSRGTTASSGGELGYISQFPFPQMESAVAVLDSGGISGVFKGPAGYYLVKLEEKREGQQKEFEEIKAELIEGLTALKQQQALLNKIAEIQQNTKVEVNEGLLEKVYEE